ncbi:MAG: hypothetical protein AABX34_04965 [Nanoarchaeota archaeon]
MHKTIYLALAISFVLFLSSCASKESEITSPLKTQQEKQATQKEAAQDNKQLLGWWEEVESWSLDPQTGNLKKNEQTFPFLREFTEKYTCQQYNAKYYCVKNLPYSISGNKITYESIAGYSEEWRIVEEKLELVKKDPKGKIFSKSLSAKVSQATSPDRKLPDYLNANLELIKASESGICVRHNSGDIVYIGDINLVVDGKNITLGTFGQFPSWDDFFIYPNEAVVLPGSFKIGSKVSVMLARADLLYPLRQKEQISWTFGKLVKETPSDNAAPYWFGFASCP